MNLPASCSPNSSTALSPFFPAAHIRNECFRMKIQLPKSRNSRILTGLAFLAAAWAIDGFLIEPNWIEVTHHSVRAPISEPLKIAHLTDLHSQGLGFRGGRVLDVLA